MIGRETIANIIYETLEDNAKTKNCSTWREVARVQADAILAAIGNPDATGDLLMRAAESGYPPALIGQADNTWVACVHNGTFGANMSGPTPADAIRAALAAAEEGL